jgi:hypothetical protein
MRPTTLLRAMKAVPKPVRLLAAGAGLSLLAWPLAAAGPELAMLAGLTKGKWEVRVRGEGVRNVCLRSGPEFIQIQHTEAGCSRFVVDDTATDVTVQYTCRGNGYGRTHVRKESAKLVQIDSTGIRGGMPFDITAEARHVGSC